MNALLPFYDPSFSGTSLQGKFLKLVPKIERHADIFFRDIKCPQRRAEAVAEAVALAWQWFIRLVQRGKDVMHFPMAFAVWVARAVKSGRRLTGMEKAKDVMSPIAQPALTDHTIVLAKLPRSTRYPNSRTPKWRPIEFGM